MSTSTPQVEPCKNIQAITSYGGWKSAIFAIFSNFVLIVRYCLFIFAPFKKKDEWGDPNLRFG